jgi:predicted lipoprotein with Yx(FWY)xxD motif
MSKLPAVLLLPAIALAMAGCGSSKSSSSSTPASGRYGGYAPTTSSTATSGPATGAVKISSVTIAGLGPVLVNAQGRTLYTFAPDKAKKVTCVSACAAVWPPAVLASGQKPVAAGPIKQSLFGSDPDPAGGRVVTYAGWPLYTYVTDTAPGHAAGQALNLNGGLWYAISPSGEVITKKP